MSQETTPSHWPERLIGFSLVVLGVAFVSSGWAFLADQGPLSPLFVGPLKGPIDRLASACWLLGLGGLGLSVVINHPRVRIRNHRTAAILFLSGSALLVLGRLVGALAGVWGTQVVYLYPKALPVIVLTTVGFGLLGACLVVLLRLWFGSRDR